LHTRKQRMSLLLSMVPTLPTICKHGEPDNRHDSQSDQVTGWESRDLHT
jgi:hypothetical protein